MGKTILEVIGLRTKYVTRSQEDVYAVDEVSFKIEEGKTLGIAGESGCGKSTLALSLMGYYFSPLHYISGKIIVDGKDLTGMKPDEVRRLMLGTEIAYIPQAAMNALNPTQKIIKLIWDVVHTHDKTKTKTEVRKMAVERFESLGLPEEVLDKYSVELSGGMKQRTVIAVSTILNPKVLIADEPSSALDVSSQKLVIKMLHELMAKGYICTLSEYLSQSRFKMRLQRRERDRTGKAEITRDRANLTETILRVCDSNNEKNGQNFISVFEVMKNKRIIG